MSWKGIKRAAARAPHLMMGNKSNDAIFESLEKEFTSAMTAVDKIIAESKNFRDSWTRILGHQLETTHQWTQTYAPIAGESSTGSSTVSSSGISTVRTYYETPQTTLQSIDSYTAVLEEVKGTLLPILNGLDGKVVQPSMDMKKALESVQKMVKKRHHKKMDYDRFTGSVEKLRNKKDKTEKDQAMLLKMESDLEAATQEFQMHDEKLKDLIPSILDSISSFFNPILQTLYSIQLSLYQHLYASLHEYAVSQGLSNTDSVVDECLHMYEPVRQKAETEIKSLREGKTAKIPVGETGMGKPGLFARRASQGTGLGGLGKSKPPPPPPPAAPPAYSTQDTGSSRPSIKSSGSYGKTPPPPPPSGSPKPKPSSSTLLSANLGRQPSNGIPAGRTPSTSSVASINSLHSLNASSPLNSVNPLNSMNGKKKPPPPPAPKPSLTPKPEFVVAKYDFAGESEGDLPFSVGDRIKVLKKTESLEDWWEGERNGQRGMFPRNYCE